MQETRKHGPYTEKLLIETIPEEAKILDLLTKTLTILNIAKEPKGTVYRELKESMKIFHQNREY